MAMSEEYNDRDSTSMNTNNNNNNSNNNNSTSKDSHSKSKSKNMGKRAGRRPGRKPAKIDEVAKLERSRQSAKECRARKKLRYQYLEELVLNREKAVYTLREELEMFKQWCIQLDRGNIPESLIKSIASEEMAKERKQAEEMRRAAQVKTQNVKYQEEQAMPSTSSAGIGHFSSPLSSPSSSSSSSSSSPAAATPRDQCYSHPPPPPTTASSLPPQPTLHHHQQHVHSRLPPPYPSSMSSPSHSHIPTTSRYTLTRQVAFDQGNDVMSHHSNPAPALNQRHSHQDLMASSITTSPDNCYVTQPTASVMHTTTPTMTSPPFSQGVLVNRNISSQSSQGEQIQMMDYKSQPHTTFIPQQQQLRLPSHLPHHHYHHQQQQQHYQQQSTLGSRPPYHAQEISSQNYPRVLSKVKSEPSNTLTHQPSLEEISDFIMEDTKRNALGQFTSNDTNINLKIEVEDNDKRTLSARAPIAVSRVRSLSNPVSMTPLSRHGLVDFGAGFVSPQSAQNQQSMSTVQTLPTAFSMSTSNITSTTIPATRLEAFRTVGESENEVGLFSGIPLVDRSMSSSMAVEESDSSDDNYHTNISHLFQSSSSPATGQKRTLSDPNLQHWGGSKKAKSLDAEMDMILTDSLLSLMSEADQRPDNLPPYHCMGSSTSPFGMVPRNTDSPMTTSSGMPSPSPSINVTPSSSTNPSPVPSSSSFLDNSGSSSSLVSAIAAVNAATSVVTTPMIENFLFSSGTNLSVPGFFSENVLNATISDPIPELYSFLEDLQTDNTGSPISQGQSHDGIASMHSKSSPMTLKQDHHHHHHHQQQNLPLSHQPLPCFYPQNNQNQEQSGFNVPSIIEELTSSDDSA